MKTTFHFRFCYQVQVLFLIVLFVRPHCLLQIFFLCSSWPMLSVWFRDIHWLLDLSSCPRTDAAAAHRTSPQAKLFRFHQIQVYIPALVRFQIYLILTNKMSSLMPSCSVVGSTLAMTVSSMGSYPIRVRATVRTLNHYYDGFSYLKITISVLPWVWWTDCCQGGSAVLLVAMLGFPGDTSSFRLLSVLCSSSDRVQLQNFSVPAMFHEFWDIRRLCSHLSP